MTDMIDFLRAFGLAHLATPLANAGMKMQQCIAGVGERTAFLERLRTLGIDKLADRQALANAISKALRAGTLKPPYRGPFEVGSAGAASAKGLVPRYPTHIVR